MSSSAEPDLNPDTTTITGKSDWDTSTGLFSCLLIATLLLGFFK